METKSSSRPPSWQQRAVRSMTRNVVQTVFSREYGFPFYGRTSEAASNMKNEGVIGRQLLMERLGKSTATKSPPEVVKIDAGKSKNACSSSSNSRSPQGLFRLESNKSTDAQIMYYDSFFWKTERVQNISPAGCGRGPGKVFSNVFYKLEQDPEYGFHAFKSSNTRGKPYDYDIVSGRTIAGVESMYSTTVIMLEESGCLTAFNLSSCNTIKDALTISIKPEKLPESWNTTRPLRFSDLTVDYDNNMIVCTGSSGGHTKCLVFVAFPRALDIKMMLYIEPKITLQTWGQIAVVVDSSKLQLFTLDAVIEESQEMCPSNNGCIQKILKEKPSVPLLVIPTINKFMGLLRAAWPPLCYTKTRDSLVINELAGETSAVPLWSCKDDAFTPLLFSPLPDVSNSALVSNGQEEYVITWIKTSDHPSRYKIIKHMPFSLGNKKSPEPSTSTSGRARIPRACKKPTNYTEQSSIIGMDYCDLLGLFLVCAIEKDCVSLTLYEATTFKIFKKLPSIPVDNGSGNGNVSSDEENNDKTDSILKAEVDLDFHLASIIIVYMRKKDRDIYVLRTLEENLV